MKFLLALLLICSTAFADIGSAIPNPPINSFYVDPVNGADSGDGSQTNPWKTLQAVIKAGLINGQDPTKGKVHAGDIIYLMTGNHGGLGMTQYTGKFVNTDFITIQALPGHTPVITGVNCVGVTNLVIRGLTVQRPDGPVVSNFNLCRFASVNNVIFEGNILNPKDGVGQWTPDMWAANSVPINLSTRSCTNMTIRNNAILNSGVGVTLDGDGILFTQNTIDCFYNDGLDFTANNLVISKNRISNHYGHMPNTNHNDGIQGWKLDGTVGMNVTIDSNAVLISTDEYESMPLVASNVGQDYMQGISLFDGVWQNINVRQNVVVCCAYHGISFYGTSDLTIENNVVLTRTTDPKIHAWIGAFASKAGVVPSNVQINGNVATSYSLLPGVVSTGNVTLMVSKTLVGVGNKQISDVAKFSDYALLKLSARK